MCFLFIYILEPHKIFSSKRGHKWKMFKKPSFILTILYPFKLGPHAHWANTLLLSCSTSSTECYLLSLVVGTLPVSLGSGALMSRSALSGSWASFHGVPQSPMFAATFGVRLVRFVTGTGGAGVYIVSSSTGTVVFCDYDVSEPCLLIVRGKQSLTVTCPSNMNRWLCSGLEVQCLCVCLHSVAPTC